MKLGLRVTGDQMVQLMEAALASDFATVKKLGGEIAQLCLEQGDELTAKRLRAFMRRRGVPLQASGMHQALPVDGVSRLPLIEEEPWPSTPVILNPSVQNVVDRFVHDVRSVKLLAEGGLLTRFGLMLSGPPGTGKSLLAGHIAAQLRRPFLIARLDSLISSRLGETAKNIRQIFEFGAARGGILFLDEIDAVAKMRDDRHELGELKRVVNTVIQGLDSLDDQAVVIAATNHPQLLDTAIWRRFPYRADIGLPNSDTRAALWLHFLYAGNAEKQERASLLGQISVGFSGADIENLALATRRHAVLNRIDLPESNLVWAITKSDPPNIQLPELGEQNTEQKREMVRRMAALSQTHKPVIADMLRISRQMVYRYLKEE